MVRLRNEGNTSTLFEFGGNTKVLAAGSLSPSFNVKMQRNQRLDAKDVLHKKGVDNLVFNFSVVLSGVDRFTNADVIIALAAAQTTIYLDTEGIKDSYNGKYDFVGQFITDIDQGAGLVTLSFQLVENAN